LPWRNAEFVFTSISPFFDSDIYSLSILKGLITSSGGLTESTLKASSNSLFEYLSQMKDPLHKKRFLGKLIQIFELNLKDERVTVPLMKTIEMLLSSDYLSEADLLDELYQIHAVTVKECNKSKNIVKLMSSAGVFAGMMIQTDPTLLQKAVRSLLFLLYHSFPRVRKLTAEKLYTALLTMDDATLVIPNGEDDYDQVIETLSETNWDGAMLKDLNPGKEKMYSYFGMVPDPKTAAPVQKDGDVEMIKT
jgi:tubulin-specific chaperone D